MRLGSRFVSPANIRFIFLPTNRRCTQLPPHLKFENGIQAIEQDSIDLVIPDDRFDLFFNTEIADSDMVGWNEGYGGLPREGP